MKELATCLGPDQNLVAVVTLPDGEPKPLAFLMLNAGVVHRIGPHRTSVKIARRLAELGYATIRFDISGVGDSRPPRDALPFRQQAVLDIKAAMDHLQDRYQLKQFGLYGICAGAMNGYAAALGDERVVGLFMFDGYAFPTGKASLVRFVSNWRGRSLRHVLGAVRNRMRRVLVGSWMKKDGNPAALAPPAASTHPTKERFAVDLQTLIGRGARVVSLYSGSVFEEYSYQGQLSDAFKGHSFLTQMTCHYAPTVDHLVTPLEAQRHLIELIEDWAGDTFEKRVLATT